MHNISIFLVIIVTGFLINHALRCYVAIKKGTKNRYMKMELTITLAILIIFLVVVIGGYILRK